MSVPAFPFRKGSTMGALVFGAGNLLYADEGVGVHLANYLEEHFDGGDTVEFFDAGTLGMMAAHKFEDPEVVIVVDALELAGEPGEIRVYDGEDIRADRIPTKMSPHQLGLQEMMMVTELRGQTPRVVKLVGVIPERMEAGELDLSAKIHGLLPKLAEIVIELLAREGYTVRAKKA